MSRLGKKVLRPGGLKLTQQLIKNLNIIGNDDVVEFAPGLGFTAHITLAKNQNRTLVLSEMRIL